VCLKMCESTVTPPEIHEPMKKSPSLVTAKDGLLVGGA